MTDLPHINPGDPVASAPINDIIDVVNLRNRRLMNQASIPVTSGIVGGTQWVNNSLMTVELKAGDALLGLMTVFYTLQTNGQGPSLSLRLKGSDWGLARPGAPGAAAPSVQYGAQVSGIYVATADESVTVGYGFTEWFGSSWSVGAGSSIRVVRL
jgi:hypothetical protein